MSPRLIASETVLATEAGQSVRLEAIADPRSGQSYLSIGIGSDARRTRLWLTAAQVRELRHKIEQLTTVL